MEGGKDGGGVVCVGVAVVAEYEVVGGAAHGGGLVPAVVANLGAHVLEGERVGGVHVLVARQAQLSRVGAAEQDRRFGVAVVARQHQHLLFLRFGFVDAVLMGKGN